MNDKAHWVALATTARIGGKTITRLLAQFGSLEAALAASTDELTQVPRIGPQTAEAIHAIDMRQVEADLVRMARVGIQVVTWEEPIYPSNLLGCDDAPPVLFMRGAFTEQDKKAVAIVGTRTPSDLGEDLAYQLGYELACRQWTIVSGLAIGIDTAAHQGALDAGGRTFAVLGSGLGNVYPHRNREMAWVIAKRGVVMAEVHPSAKVSPQNLVARNRITSGLSKAVIVVEAEKDSGSLNTARRAWKQGRRVFTVAHSAAGCDELIAAGAETISREWLDWDAFSTYLTIELPKP
ncbi:MAG: DNA-processing protein DprA [Chloroflexota bacterium]